MSDRTLDWDSYIDAFHAERAGITEELLARSVDDQGRTPYEWLADDLPRGRVLDLGCGSGPMQPFVERWIGLDRSPSELDVAQRHGRGPLLRASATELPIADGKMAAVVAAMSLMVIDEPLVALDEVRRVLEPGGLVHVLLPGARPLTLLDRARYAAMLAAFGRVTLSVPRPDVTARPHDLLGEAGFVVTADDRRRFAFPITGPDDADAFVRSMYTPRLSARRMRAARGVARHWGTGAIGLPLRRVTARKVA